MKVRADVLVQRRGLAESRSRAQALILAGSVIAGDHRVEKPGQLLDESVEVRVKEQLRYCSICFNIAEDDPCAGGKPHFPRRASNSSATRSSFSARAWVSISAKPRIPMFA